MSQTLAFPTARTAGLPCLGGKDMFVTHDGNRVRGHLWLADAQARGRVVICPGFTEFAEKHSRGAEILHQAGFDLLIIDWPGQGRSGHFGKHPLIVHADGFDGHLQAAEALIEAVGWADQPLSLIGHSMGGHLALRLAHRKICRVTALVLLSPMISLPVKPLWLGWLISRLAIACGQAQKPAAGQAPRQLDHVRQHKPNNVLTRDADRYEENFLWFDDEPSLRRSGASWGWVFAGYASCLGTTMSRRWMAAIDIPVLALTADDETVVHKASTSQMLRVLPQCEHHEYADAKHELCLETEVVRSNLWSRITRFLPSA